MSVFRITDSITVAVGQDFDIEIEGVPPETQAVQEMGRRLDSFGKTMVVGVNPTNANFTFKAIEKGQQQITFPPTAHKVTVTIN